MQKEWRTEWGIPRHSTSCNRKFAAVVSSVHVVVESSRESPPDVAGVSDGAKWCCPVCSSCAGLCLDLQKQVSLVSFLLFSELSYSCPSVHPFISFLFFTYLGSLWHHFLLFQNYPIHVRPSVHPLVFLFTYLLLYMFLILFWIAVQVQTHNPALSVSLSHIHYSKLSGDHSTRVIISWIDTRGSTFAYAEGLEWHRLWNGTKRLFVYSQMICYKHSSSSTFH